MKKYNAPEIEIIDSPDVVSTSTEVETERIPLMLPANESSYNT